MLNYGRQFKPRRYTQLVQLYDAVQSIDEFPLVSTDGTAAFRAAALFREIEENVVEPLPGGFGALHTRIYSGFATNAETVVRLPCNRKERRDAKFCGSVLFFY